LRDAIYFVVYLASFASNRITWGSQQFIMRDGQMVQQGRTESTEGTGSPMPPKS
jgi:hypothetical protein